MKPEAKVLENGRLALTVGKYSVDFSPDADAEALRIGTDLLIEQVAGVTRHEITMAAYKALFA